MKWYLLIAALLLGYWYITPQRVTVITQTVTAQAAATAQPQQVAPSATNYRQQFAIDLAKALGNNAPNEAIVLYLESWAKAEGGSAAFNPLNTTQPMDGATDYNSVGVKNYTSYQQGLDATVKTLQGGYTGYAGIAQGVQQNNPQLALTSLAASPWGTNAALVRDIYNEAIAARTTSQAQPVAYVPSDTEAPHGSPFKHTNVTMSQGYGIGSHAPANVWGGIDLVVNGTPSATEGATVYAIMGGFVRTSTTYPCGNGVEITKGGYRVLYCHLSGFTVQNGATVHYGDPVATAGHTGAASGPHLHLEVWHNGVNQNPINYVTR